MIILRKEAINLGLKKYFTGKPCKRGHLSERRVSTNDCVDCARERQKTEKVKLYKNEYYEKNKNKILENANNHYQINKVKKIKYASIYQKNNLKKITLRRKNRLLNDDLYASKQKIRSLIKISFSNKSYTKKSKTHKILGCGFDEFKIHIEKQFLKGMGWHNRGEWHLDHIVPMSTAKNEEEVIALNHFTNFRPLWAKDNLEKSNKKYFLI